MKNVPLHGKHAHGRTALVDDEDYELVMQYRWSVLEHDPAAPGRRSHGPYAICDLRRTRRKVGETLWMHQLITGWPRVDHQDGDGLNNQRYNLRRATKSQNGANARKNPGKSSRYKGVTWDRSRSRWSAKVMVNGTTHNLGRFADEDAAARAYDAAALAAWGEFALVNFPVSRTPLWELARSSAR